MNLSPDWVEVFRAEGWESFHWSQRGDPRAPDEEIMSWARERGAVIVTQDLGFGALLALTRATSPSVVLLRTTSTLVVAVKGRVVPAIRAVSDRLEEGAVLVIGDRGHRVRLLPFDEPR